MLLFFLQRVLKITIPTNTLVLLIKHGMQRGLRSPQFQIRSTPAPPPPPEFRFPHLIQGSKVSPFSLSISLCAEDLNLPSIDNPYMTILATNIFYIFSETNASGRIFPTISPQLMQQSYFFILTRLKINAKYFSFSDNTFISNTRLRFNLK